MARMMEIFIALLAIYCITLTSSYRIPRLEDNFKDLQDSVHHADDSSIGISKRSLGQQAHSVHAREIDWSGAADDGRTSICDLRNKARDVQNLINVTFDSMINGLRMTPHAENILSELNYTMFNLYNLTEADSTGTPPVPGQEPTTEQQVLRQMFRTILEQKEYLDVILKRDTYLGNSTNENATIVYNNLFAVRDLLGDLRSLITGRIGLSATTNIRPIGTVMTSFLNFSQSLTAEWMRATMAVSDTYGLMTSFLDITRSSTCPQ